MTGKLTAAAVLRIGSDSSKSLDNFSRGGLSFAVDVASGIIGLGFTKRDGRTQLYERHPDTGAIISGEQIPFWPSVLSDLKKAFRKSRLHYVGWDVIVTENGPSVLEGNNYSDVNLLQVHEPLLTNSQAKDFYNHHRILKWMPA